MSLIQEREQNYEKENLPIEKENESNFQTQQNNIIQKEDNNPNLMNTLSEEFNTISKNKMITDNLLNNQFSNDEYIKDLKYFYQKHFNDLFTDFKSCLDKLEDVARQNRNNKITGSLLKEIINDKLFYEREEQIANLIAEINETKKQKEKIKLEIFQAELESMKKKYEIELNKKNKYKDNVRTLQAAVEEKKNEIAKLQTKINVFSDNLQKKREEFEKLNKNVSQFEKEKVEFEIKYKNIEEENKSYENILKNFENNKEILKKNYEIDKEKIIQGYENEKKTLIQNFNEEKEKLLQQCETEKEKILQEAETEKEKILQEAETEKEKLAQQYKIEKEKLLEKSETDLENLSQQFKTEKEKILQESNTEYEKLLKQSNTEKEKILQQFNTEKKKLLQQFDNENQELKRKITSQYKMQFNIILKEKLLEIQDIKECITTIKKEYKIKYNEFISQYKNSISLIQSKILEYDKICLNQLKSIEKKYDKHLNDQLVLNNKLQRQNEELISKKNETDSDSQKLQNKITELETELKNNKIALEKLQKDLDSKNKENISINDKNLLLVKNLNNLMLMLTKLKKKYLSIIFTLKTQINGVKDLYINDMKIMVSTTNTNANNNMKILNNKLTILQGDNMELREMNEKMQARLNQLIDENEQKNRNINHLNEQLLIKQQKINNLHNVFNKSISSYNNGIKNIQIAQKLDNDVQELIEKAKNQMTTTLSDN